jgi:hypothetical protein
MKAVSQLLVAFGFAVGMAATAQATPITGGTTQLTLVSAPLLAMLGATISPLGTATLMGTPPVATMPITGGSTSAKGDIIQQKGSGLEISATSPTTIVDTRNYVINTITEVITASVSINSGPATNLALFTLGSAGLSDVPFYLTPGAVTALNKAFGIDALNTSIEIGTMTSSPNVGVGVPEPATAAIVGMGLLALASVRRRMRSSLDTESR